MSYKTSSTTCTKKLIMPSVLIKKRYNYQLNSIFILKGFIYVKKNVKSSSYWIVINRC